MSDKVVFQLNKLVRDKLVDDMRAKGQEPEVTELKGKAKTLAKIAKLLEELKELDPNSSGYAEELADAAQILGELIKDSGEDIEAIRRKKLEEKGGFETGKLVARLALDPDDEWVEYYRQDPIKYPEVTHD